MGWKENWRKGGEAELEIEKFMGRNLKVTEHQSWNAASKLQLGWKKEEVSVALADVEEEKPGVYKEIPPEGKQ